MQFFTGCAIPAWLGRTSVSLFVSRARLAGLKKLPRALGPWALDSGAFTMLDQHGRWIVGPERYADEVQHWSREIGRLEWAAIQDHPCEDRVLRMTGLTVQDHQRATVESYLRLRELAPSIAWTPVLQGRTLGDYLRHADDYRCAGVELRELPVVGVGSICRRQQAIFAGIVLRWLADEGLKLHGFGFKTTGLLASQDCLVSADSMAWSFNARRSDPLTECSGRHRRCTSCMAYALEWREALLDRLSGPSRREGYEHSHSFRVSRGCSQRSLE